VKKRRSFGIDKGIATKIHGSVLEGSNLPKNLCCSFGSLVISLKKQLRTCPPFLCFSIRVFRYVLSQEFEWNSILEFREAEKGRSPFHLVSKATKRGGRSCLLIVVTLMSLCWMLSQLFFRKPSVLVHSTMNSKEELNFKKVQSVIVVMSRSFLLEFFRTHHLPSWILPETPFVMKSIVLNVSN
jgi:hypothetical protein